jgi:hypothetical protein
VGWQKAIDELARIGECARGGSLMCLVHNVKKVLEGAVTMPGKYSKLIQEAMSGYREEQ